ncbi:MAG: response regulator [Nanoarchaeota archaeon]|nr:response regulator [Nanoarchaeota archaeon]
MIKIMHVDDNKDTRKVVKLMLRSEGYDIISIASGKSCIDKLKTEKPNLILLDIMMPKMSGWDVFQEIKKYKLRGTKVAFFSIAPVSQQKKQELYKKGAVGYITKPFTSEELIKKVKKIIREEPLDANKEITINDFIKKIEHKDDIKILSEIIVNLITLKAIKKDSFESGQDIIKKVVSKLEIIITSDSLEDFLLNLTNGVRYKKLVQERIKKELTSKFKTLIVSSSLYDILSSWERYGLLKSKGFGKNKLYKLTNKSYDAEKLLVDHMGKEGIKNIINI